VIKSKIGNPAVFTEGLKKERTDIQIASIVYPFHYAYFNLGLAKTLSQHSVSNLNESSDVSTLNVVDSTVSFLTVLNTVVVDVLHDALKLVVNLLSSPRDTT
jgi:hypothetical protein